MTRFAPSWLAATFRRLVREPGSALLIVLILALTTGAGAVTFTLIDAILLDRLPFSEPDRLVQLTAAQGGVAGELSMRELRDVDELTSLFSGIAAYKPPRGGYTMGGESSPVQAPAVLVTHNLFSVLGVAPAVGSSFPATYDLERSFGIVLSDRLYRSQLGSDPDALKQTLTLDGAPKYTIFGVMPPGFDFPARTDFYRSIYINERNPNLEDRSSRVVLGVARLAPGITLQAARARLAALSTQLAADHPHTNRGVELRLTPLADVYAGDLSAYLWILATGVCALLAVGWVNASNLLLSRALPRAAELALQAALGASRPLLAARFLVEGLILSATGALLGLGLAQLTLGALRSLVRFDLPTWVRLEMDVSTVVFLALLALLTALAAGIVPALRLSRVEAGEALRAGGRGVAGDRANRGLSRLLVATQVTLAFMLLASTAALLTSFQRLSRADPGFEPAQLLSFKVNLPWFLYSRREPAELDLFHQRVIDELTALPAVDRAGLTTDLPFTEGAGSSLLPFVAFGGDPNDSATTVRLRQADVSPELFDVLGMTLVDGRGFSADDRPDTLPVAILSQRAASRMWPGEAAIGQRLRVAEDPEEPWREVVGVIADVRRAVDASSWREDPAIFLPASQTHPRNVHFVLRARGIEAETLIRGVEQVVWRVDSQQPIWDISTMSLRHEAQLWREKTVTLLVSAFAAVALLLATSGLYGVLAQSVRQRRHEMGVRMALGADAARVARLVAGEAGRMVVAGLVVGGLLTLFLLRWLASLVPFFDPPSAPALLAAGGVLALFALLSAFGPAREAASTAPIRALREDL